MPEHSQSELQDEAPRLLREVAYERLRDAITTGELLPGTPLSETQLSKELEISRTPVREALQQLEREGLVHIIPGRAITVAAPSMQEVMDVVHMRYMLEPEVARLAAKSGTEEMRETLRQTIEQMVVAAEKGDRAGWSRLDTLFHETIGEACANKLMGKIAFQMRNRVHYTINDPQTSLKRIVECTAEHKAVADAILAGDPSGAEQAVRDHLNKLRESYFQRFAHL